MIKVREVRIGKEVKRSNGWWRFTCGDVFINVYQCWSWPLSWSLRCSHWEKEVWNRNFLSTRRSASTDFLRFRLSDAGQHLLFEWCWASLLARPDFCHNSPNTLTHDRFKMRKQIDLRGFKGQDSSITGAKVLQNCASLILICIYLHLISSDVWYPVTRAD